MKFLITSLFTFLTLTVFSQENIQFHAANIEIDGELTDEIWQQIKPLTNFQNHFPNDVGAAENQTEVKVFHNKKMLYIGAVYHDSRPDNNISSLKRDIYQDAMFLSDCFGVVLDPFDKGDSGYYFGVNASGVQYDALIGNINNLNESWNAIWQAKVSKSGNDKFYEIAIPLNAVNFDPQRNLWGVQFFINDTKINQFSTLEHSPRNYVQYDLRFMKKMSVEELPNKVSQKFSILPSVALNYSENQITETNDKGFTPSLDAQYNINSSLRIDATLNPDFSQVEVDQQVTNLTRFSVFFPERRKFFLENSDLFNNLGTGKSNPFYSRRIGSETDILAGAKLSGNIAPKTRIGLLNVQTKDEEATKGKNYTVAVGRQNLWNNSLIGTGFLVNSQQSAKYNRVAGGILNYKSKDKKWTSNFNYSKAFDSQFSEKEPGRNDFVNTEVDYQTRTFHANLSLQNIGRNHVTETGFTPELYQFDAGTNETTREGFKVLYAKTQLKHFHKKAKLVDWSRRFYFINVSTFNSDNSLRDNFFFYSPFAIRFRDRSYVYATYIHRIENLQYNFDVLQNGNFIPADNYKYSYGRVGYWSPTNEKTYYTLRFEYGQFYSGTRLNPEVNLSYRLIPRAVLSASYEINRLDLKELGQKTFHLAKLTTEVYFSNRLNWTTYFQYNTQRNNFNINSRFQWEYKPLSYVYLVFSNNYDNHLIEQNWGVSFKVNRRLDF